MRLRKAFAFVAIVGVFSGAAIVPAGASHPEPTFETRSRFVHAAGDWTFSLNSDGTQAIEYACVGASGVDSAATVLTECSIWVNGRKHADFPLAASGNAVVSAGRYNVPLGVVQLCYQARAYYTDGSTQDSIRLCS